MKKLFTLIPALLFFFFVEGQPKRPLDIEVFQQELQQSLEFTSNRFSSINISKDGVVWAGTVYEGLYRYDTKSEDYKTWKKSTVAPKLFINDIKADPHGGIWVAESGNRNPGGSHIEGGVNHIPDARRDSVVFYSMSGTQTEGYFYSRNLVSLFISDSNRTYPGSPPESMIFAAQGLSRITGGGDIIRGGLNSHTIGFSSITQFDRIAGRSFTAFENSTSEPSGWDWRRKSPLSSEQLSKPYAECIGGNSTGEVWVAVRDNYDMTEIVRYTPNGTPKGKEASYNYTNSTIPQYSQPRAIHFDEDGNKWITTRYDGIMVLVDDEKWTQLKLSGILPGNVVFNRNAIAEDEWGNIYFGTDAGMLVYKSARFNHQSFGPISPNSYELFTVADGLPGNNITGLAYDAINGKVLVAIDGGGVAFVNVKPDNIEGSVFDVYTGILNNEITPSSNFRKIPISTAATVRLYLGEELIDIVEPNNEGKFQFSEDEPGNIYTVTVDYINRDNTTMKYIYPDIKSNSKVPPVYIPDSLIREIKSFEDSLKIRTVKYMVLSLIPVEREFDGFIVDRYNLPLDQFFYPNEIKSDHQKKVDNLGIYLANLKSVYDLGGNATELAIDGLNNGWSFLKSMKSALELNTSLGKMSAKDFVLGDKEAQDALVSLTMMSIKQQKKNFMTMLNLNSKLLTLAPEVKPLLDLVIAGLDAAFDFVIEVVEKGIAFSSGKADIIENIIDVVAKVVSAEIGGYVYTNWYARGVHEGTISQAIIGSVKSKSSFSYNSVNLALVAPSGESILHKAKESMDFYKNIVGKLNTISNLSEQVNKTVVLAETLALVPGGQPIAAAAVTLSKVLKAVELGALGGAMVADFRGSYKQVDFSEKVLDKSGIHGLEASHVERKGKMEIRRDPNPPSQSQPVELLESKNNYNEKVSAIQTLLGASSFTSGDYTSRLKELILADSVYTKETKNAFDRLMASSDSAIKYIPDFGDKLDYMMDTFVNQQSNYKFAFLLNQYAVLTDVDNKADYLSALDSTANELKVLNDSIYNSFLNIINLINENGVGAPAYLTQSDYVMDHEFEPGTSGTFTNTYTNYGTEAMRNVSFKINEATEGFSITSADSIYIGDIAPGATIQISFNFDSPLETDSITIGRYEIDVKADNGKFNNTSGSLMIIRKEALPVTLINFKVSCSGNNTELSWETTSESNSSHFEIEKSSNGIDWIVVRRVNTAGNSSIRRLYKLIDQSSENSFYRLKHVDLDGKYSYSNVLRSKCGIERPMISVYPVPAKDVVNILAVATKASVAKVVLLDITGREVRRLNAALQAGTNTIKLNISSLPSGQYILKVDGTEINKSMKITISK